MQQLKHTHRLKAVLYYTKPRRPPLTPAQIEKMKYWMLHDICTYSNCSETFGRDNILPNLRTVVIFENNNNRKKLKKKPKKDTRTKFYLGSEVLEYFKNHEKTAHRIEI